jgi:hypothetical protein
VFLWLAGTPAPFWPWQLKCTMKIMKISGIWQPLMAGGKLSPHRNFTVRKPSES